MFKGVHEIVNRARLFLYCRPTFNTNMLSQPKSGIRDFLACFALLVVCGYVGVGSATAQFITVMRDGKSSQQAVLRINGNVYVPVKDIASLVGAQTSGAHDSIVTFFGGSAAFTANTPFVWTTRGTTMKLLQMALSPVQRIGILYVPVWGAVNVMHTLTPKPLAYDPQLERLTIGVPPVTAPPPAPQVTPKPATPIVKSPPRVKRDSIRSILVEARSNGVLVTIEYTAPPIFRPVVIPTDANRAGVFLGQVGYDSLNSKCYAGTAIDEEYFVVNHDSITLQLAVIDSIESANRHVSGSTVSFTLRTSRRTVAATAADPKRDRWKMDIVVLDAGHGGKDPGAQGLGGTNEADVTLGIVLKLGKILEKAGLKVVYTRKSDVFVELYRRAQIANEAKGKLFISVHCNSMPTKPSPANGFESYILRPGKNETAVRVAQRENNVIGLEADRTRYQGTTEEAFIVAAMAQSGFVKYSERFATQVQSELGKHCPGAKNNGVSQAGFLVLVGASMPNILIETGYVSHTREEHVLASNAGQQRYAEGIAAAVKKYRTTYEHAMSR